MFRAVSFRLRSGLIVRCTFIAATSGWCRSQRPAWSTSARCSGEQREAQPAPPDAEPAAPAITNDDLMVSLLGESWQAVNVPLLPKRSAQREQRDSAQREPRTSEARISEDGDSSQPAAGAPEGDATCAPDAAGVSSNDGQHDGVDEPAASTKAAEGSEAAPKAAAEGASRRSSSWIESKKDEVSKRLKQRGRGRIQMSPYTILPVVAACVYDQEKGRVLIAQRPVGKRLQGLWEFPGGKVESTERPEVALIREMREELNIELKWDALTPATFVSKPLGNRHLLMVLYVCTEYSGIVRGMEKQQFAWATFDELRSKYKFAPGDETFAVWAIEHLDPTSAFAVSRAENGVITIPSEPV